MKKIALILCLVLAFSFAVLPLSACGARDYVAEYAKTADTYTAALSFHPDEKTISAAVVFEWTNRTQNTFDQLHFHIFANAMREGAQKPLVSTLYKTACFFNGASYGEVAFDSVKADGVASAFSIGGEDCDILVVPLGKTVFPDETATVEMTFEITLPNAKYRAGYGDNTVNLGNVIPLLCMIENGSFCDTPFYQFGDPFVSQTANFSVTLTAPQTFLVAATGNEMSKTTADGVTTHVFQATARDFALCLSEKYRVVSSEANGVAVEYFYFDDSAPEQTLATAQDSLNYFSEKIAPYPYAKYTVAQTDLCFGGMEYPMLSFVSRDADNVKDCVAHETAHQWFYGIVGSNQIENAWMDEGLADFLTMLYLDFCGEKPLKESAAKYLKSYTTYCDVLTNYLGSFDTSMRSLDKYKTEQEYIYVNYVKGALLFHEIYQTAGDKKFFACLSNYFAKCKLTVATPEEMIACFSAAYGAPMNDFFNGYVDGKGTGLLKLNI